MCRPCRLVGLHKAIIHDRLRDVKSLIAKRADVNAVCQKETAFTQAIKCQRLDAADSIMNSANFNPNAKNDTEASPLLLSVNKQNVGFVERLLVLRARVNDADRLGNTPLIACALVDDDRIAELLVSHGADINQADDMGRTPLHHACTHSAFKLVRVLVRYGCNLDVQCHDGKTPLMLALPNFEQDSQKISDRLRVCRMLVQVGSNLNMQDVTGKTALHMAVESSDVHGLCLLAENGCQLNIRNNLGRTALHAAILNQQPAFDIARFLLFYGADAGEPIRELSGILPVRPLSVVFNFRILPNDVEMQWSRNQLLHLLMRCVYPHRDMLRQCDINYYTANNNEPLANNAPLQAIEWLQATRPCSLQHQAKLKVRQMLGHATIIPAIYRLEIPRELKRELKNDLRLGLHAHWLSISPLFDLYLGIKLRKNNLVRTLLLCGLEINVALVSRNPMAEALKHGNTGAALILLNRLGTNPIVVMSTRDTVLHVAAQHGRHEIFDRILLEYPDINVKNVFDQTPLHVAIHAGQFTMAASLIRRGADLDTADNRMSLLHMASASGSPEVVQLLLEHGMDPNLEDSFHNTPLHVAASKGRLYIEQNIPVPEHQQSMDQPSRDAAQVTSRYAQVIRLLVVRGGSLRRENAQFLTPARCAVHFQHIGLVELLHAIGRQPGPRANA